LNRLAACRREDPAKISSTTRDRRSSECVDVPISAPESETLWTHAKRADGSHPSITFDSTQLPDALECLVRAFSKSFQSRRFGGRPATSGLPLTTDIVRPTRLVRLVPNSEVVGPYSITSSARASSVAGTVRPSAFAVFSTLILAYRRTAIAEISTFKSRGKRATSTVARAGGASLK
jgi:hypothetical protein